MASTLLAHGSDLMPGPFECPNCGEEIGETYLGAGSTDSGWYCAPCDLVTHDDDPIEVASPC